MVRQSSAPRRRCADTCSLPAGPIAELAAQRGLSNVRLFGPVARGEDHAGSDIDLLVDPPPDTTLFDTAAFASDVQHLLGSGRRVDVTSSRVADPVPPEAVTL